jgi:hypothetical protein
MISLLLVLLVALTNGASFDGDELNLFFDDISAIHDFQQNTVSFVVSIFFVVRPMQTQNVVDRNVRLFLAFQLALAFQCHTRAF